jgi:adenylate cyclase
MRALSAFEARLRLGTALVLATFLLQHLVNHAVGIVSIEAAEAYRKTVGAAFQVLPGQILLYGSILFHATIALRSLYRRSSLRMSSWQWMQLLLGLSILPLVVGHATGNRGYALLGDVDPNYYYVVTSMMLKPVILVKLLLLIAVIWVHMSIGLHFWLRVKDAYPRFVPYLYAVAVLLPVLAYVGIFRMLQQATAWQDDQDRLDQIYAANNAMPSADVEFLQAFEMRAWIFMGVLLLAVLIARQLRLWWQARRGTYLITCADGSKVRALIGISLLDALRSARIPHAAVCGGRARCTTCRVRVGTGLQDLPAPAELE